MNKKGFTLIELLAVIVILAILALIVTPIILNIVEKAQEGADKRSLEQYAKIIKQDYLERKLNNSLLNLDEYLINYASGVIYDGDEVVCVNHYLENNEIVLEKCTVNGRGYYNYVDGKVTKVEDKPVDSDNNSDNNNDDVDDNSSEEIKETQFAKDSWETIATNVRTGNTNMYNVGDTKEIKLEGFENLEEGSNGLYTVRIANNSTPSECNQEGFSQTACGFVIEFVDIITNHNMNSTNTNEGGWRDSDMRAYVTPVEGKENSGVIYNALPEDLRNIIIETKVVSGHGYYDSSNFTTTDKLYLLSTQEVWENETSRKIGGDTARDNTRQLDYYKSIGVTTINYSGAIKKDNGRATWWWLCSAEFNNSSWFYRVDNDGDWYNDNAHDPIGVAVAFRIG